jgi:hypothetical protein
MGQKGRKIRGQIYDVRNRRPKSQKEKEPEPEEARGKMPWE